jgi:parvulin-like peptidyl-prolyl isomerase
MDWRCVAAVLVGVAVGCQTERPGLAGVDGVVNGRPPVPGGLMQLRDDASPSTSRLQKSDEPEQRPVAPTGFLSRTAAVETPDEQIVSSIRATVNGVPILDGEVRSACYYLLQQTQNLSEGERQARQKEILDKTLEAMIERELVLQEANARFGGKNSKFMDKLKEAAAREFERQVVKSLKVQNGIKNDEEFKAKLKGLGVSLESLKKQFEKQFIYQEYLRFRAGPELERMGAEQIREYFKSHAEEFQTVDSVDWQDLFVAASRHPSREAARQFAEQLRQRAIKGDDFVQLVKEHDNGDASYRNGEGFGHKRGEIKPTEAEAVLFSLKDGQVGPLVELTNGFHIVRLVKRENAGKVAFDAKTQSKIREKLRTDIFTRVSKRVFSELKRKATIEIASKEEK